MLVISLPPGVAPVCGSAFLVSLSLLLARRFLFVARNLFRAGRLVLGSPSSSVRAKSRSP